MVVAMAAKVSSNNNSLGDFSSERVTATRWRSPAESSSMA
jgi:hypothetical protein